MKSGKVIINRCWGFQWRWLTDKTIRWHNAFVVDFTKNGKRFVLVSVPLLFVHGLNGHDFKKYYSNYLSLLKNDFDNPNPNMEVRKVDEMKIEVPDMRLWGNELWDIRRMNGGKPTDVIFDTKFSLSYSFRSNMTDPQPFDIGFQGNLFEDLSLFSQEADK